MPSFGTNCPREPAKCASARALSSGAGPPGKSNRFLSWHSWSIWLPVVSQGTLGSRKIRSPTEATSFLEKESARVARFNLGGCGSGG